MSLNLAQSGDDVHLGKCNDGAMAGKDYILCVKKVTDGAAAPSAICGNGVVEAGEQCDGSDLGGQTCITQGFDAGTLGCISPCTFDTSQCISNDRF